MTEEQSTAVATDDSASAGPGAPGGSPVAALTLAALSLLWLAAMLFSARATITGREQAEMEVTATAYALPGAISGSLVAGTAVALAGLALAGRRHRRPGATARVAIATGAGLGTGLLAALSIVTINAEGWIYAVVGGTVAAAATIGGAIAALRAPRVLAATCWAALAVFALGLGLNLFQSPLLDLLGTGDTQASQANAVNIFALAQSVGGGLVAGLIGYAALRRTGLAPLRWPFYGLAGAGPGLVLLVAEALARTAGARVLDLAGKISVLELAAQDLLSSSRVNNALIVTFVGAVTAIIAIGRTLSTTRD